MGRGFVGRQAKYGKAPIVKENIFYIEPEVAVIIPEKKEKAKPEVKVGF